MTSETLPVIAPEITWSNATDITSLSDAAGLSKALSGYRTVSDFANCLLPLLTALKWRGNPRHVAESLPHFADTLDITGVRNVMAQLNFSSRPMEKVVLGQVDPRLMPCLFVPDDGPASVLISIEGGLIHLFNGDTASVQSLPVGRGGVGTAYLFTETDPQDASRQEQQRVGWFRVVMQRFRPLIYQIFIVTLVMNVLSLATPLFVMGVYDKVVGSRSVPTLAMFFFGVLLALGADLVLRGIRAKILSHMGARLDNIIGTAVFQRILYLSPAFTERATLGAQVARIKDFESIREFFTGPLAVVIIELPFMLFYITVIGILGGVWLALVPIVSSAMFALLGALMFPIVKSMVTGVSKVASQRQEFLVETLSKMRSVKYIGAESVWLKRYRDMASKVAVDGFRASQVSGLINTLSHMLVVLSGLGTLGIGVITIFDGNMTVGALIACMILIWRVLSPLQTGFMTSGRLESIRSSIRQIDGLMNLKPERDPKEMVQSIKRFKGRVTFSRVSLRYSADSDPALVGASFHAEPGEVVCVVGPNGSGKSTVVKLIAGLYQPQAGAVRIDNLDIRQLDPIELRHSVGYVPQVTNFFYGTIAQNLRLSHPLATDAELEWALDQAGALEEVRALPRGIQTRIGDSNSDQMPTSFTQMLNLARGYVKRSPIMLFDEPVNGLDFDGDQRFIAAVDRMRGHSTVFIVTHRPSHLKIADRILLFEGGYLRLGGPADEVRAQVPMDML